MYFNEENTLFKFNLHIKRPPLFLHDPIFCAFRGKTRQLIEKLRCLKANPALWILKTCHEYLNRILFGIKRNWIKKSMDKHVVIFRGEKIYPAKAILSFSYIL